MNIIIGADFVPTETNEGLFINAEMEQLFGKELCQLIEQADYRIFNLETPLTNKSSPIRKCGPNLTANTETVNLYKAIKVDLLTLANNHIMDQGEEGLASTIATLSENKIGFIGAGNNLQESCRYCIVKIGNKKVGIYACTEHEFSVAGIDSPGACPFDPLVSYDDVERIKRSCDLLIVLYHGGKEHYRYPSPELQRICRRFVDKGADYVICQHSHCVGCQENYNNGCIIYGQGNFLFDRSDTEEWQTGILIQINDNGVQYIPIKKNREKVRLANNDEGKFILDGFRKRSEEIKKYGFVEKNFEDFSVQMLDEYLWQLSGAANSFIMRLINRISGYRFYRLYVRKKYKSQQQLNILNYFMCEAHREVIIEALSIQNK